LLERDFHVGNLPSRGARNWIVLPAQEADLDLLLPGDSGCHPGNPPNSLATRDVWEDAEPPGDSRYLVMQAKSSGG